MRKSHRWPGCSLSAAYFVKRLGFYVDALWWCEVVYICSAATPPEISPHVPFQPSEVRVLFAAEPPGGAEAHSAHRRPQKTAAMTPGYAIKERNQHSSDVCLRDKWRRIACPSLRTLNLAQRSRCCHIHPARSYKSGKTSQQVFFFFASQSERESPPLRLLLFPLTA